MPEKVRITVGTLTLEGQLNDTKTARTIHATLPIRGRVNTWGNEIYFSVPLELEIENGKEVVETGDIGYWPDGPSLCVFFGTTPKSRGTEIRAASPVTIVGKISGDTSALKTIRSGNEIIIEEIG